MDLVFAYLDPGSGSLIIQGLIAAVIAVPVLFRNKISAMVRAVRGGDATQETKETVAEPTSTDSPVR
jgi:hypothetical protein